jgi:hypothetical protein
MADQPRPRRRFQFRLRTLMIVVTLTAVLCSYAAREAKIVREREAILASIKNAGGDYILAGAPPVYVDAVWLNDGKPLLQQFAKGREESRPSMLRRWLGDVAVIRINAWDSRTELEIARCFPEANIYAPEDAATGRVIKWTTSH